MTDVIDPSEYIEFIILPDDRIDLVEFARALEAINSEYRRWLREHSEFDHRDRDLRLVVEKVSEGSLKLWISKGRDLLFPVLQGFYAEVVKTFLDELMASSLPDNVPVKRLTNFRAILRWDFRFRYQSPKRIVELETAIQGDTRLEAQDKISELLAGKTVKEALAEAITFVGFHQEGNARVIATSFSQNEVKTFMAPEVRTFFLAEAENFLRPNKQYLVDMQVHYRQGEIEHYNVTRVISS
jgi:hypothetical protein